MLFIKALQPTLHKVGQHSNVHGATQYIAQHSSTIQEIPMFILKEFECESDANISFGSWINSTETKMRVEQIQTRMQKR